MNKYHAIPVTIDGIRFPSRGEGAFYKRLKQCIQLGLILDFKLQVPFKLHAGIKYIADFQVIMPDGSIRVLDFKGIETPIFRLKKKLFESQYGKLDVVTVNDLMTWPTNSKP